VVCFDTADKPLAINQYAVAIEYEQAVIPCAVGLFKRMNISNSLPRSVLDFQWPTGDRLKQAVSVPIKCSGPLHLPHHRITASPQRNASFADDEEPVSG
jgi:hypothetical protein